MIYRAVVGSRCRCEGSAEEVAAFLGWTPDMVRKRAGRGSYMSKVRVERVRGPSRAARRPGETDAEAQERELADARRESGRIRRRVQRMRRSIEEDRDGKRD